jgi:hypothetical protein
MNWILSTVTERRAGGDLSILVGIMEDRGSRCCRPEDLWKEPFEVSGVYVDEYVGQQFENHIGGPVEESLTPAQAPEKVKGLWHCIINKLKGYDILVQAYP